MSHLKRALYVGEHDGELLVREVRPGERVKTASILPAVQDFISYLRPDPKFTYVLVNAMGYSEFYGANANTDWYGYNPHLDFNGLLHTPSDFGKNVEVDRMRGRGWPYGYPTFYGATVYAHHRNTDPERLGFGDVIYACANPHMKRIELVQRIFNEEAAKKGHSSVLSRIRAGERVDVSMGCKVPFDLCSICTDWDEVKKAWKTFDPKLHRHPGIAVLAYHRTAKPIRGLAVTKADYCEHMTGMRGKILSDGRKVFVYNDFPRFFDISFVWIGADRTARVMWHLADSTPRNEGLSAFLFKTSSVESRRSDVMKTAAVVVRNKLSEIEKEVPDGFVEKVLDEADREPKLDTEAIKKLLDNFGGGPRAVLTTLAGLGIILSPQEFQRIVLCKTAAGMYLLPTIEEKNGVFDTETPDIDDTFAVSPEFFDQKIASVCSILMESRSSFAPFLDPRLDTTPQKTASEQPSILSGDVMSKLAAQYNGYRLSVLEKAGEIFPKSAAYMGPEVFLQEKRAGLGVAGLLLGLGSVIHLVSSHLRKKRERGQELGAVAQFVADNPTFSSMTTIGGALRAAMSVERAGGLRNAARALVGAAKTALILSR